MKVIIIGGGNMIKRNGKKIAAVAIAGALMMQNMSVIFAMDEQVESTEKDTLEVLSEVSTESKEKSNETIDLELLTFNDFESSLIGGNLSPSLITLELISFFIFSAISFVCSNLITSFSPAKI